jgi:hypothetical protein
MSELPVMLDHEIQDANDCGWTTVPAKHKNTLKNSPSNKRKVEDSFVDGVNSRIELQFLYLMGLPMRWMGLKDYVQSTEIHLVGGLNENSPLNRSCGPNKSIRSQLKMLRFGTVSNTTEYYTTVFESDDQVGIWNLEFLTFMLVLRNS